MGGVIWEEWREGNFSWNVLYKRKIIFNLKRKKKDPQKEEASTMTTYICKVELGLYFLNFIQKRIM